MYKMYETVFQEKKKKVGSGREEGKKKRKVSKLWCTDSSNASYSVAGRRGGGILWRAAPPELKLHHRSSKQRPLKRTPVTNMAAATGCSEGLHDARWERILPAPIKIHHACNKVLRKLTEKEMK